MAIQIVGIRLSGGTDLPHIVRLWWREGGTGPEKDNSRAEIVSLIDDQGGKAYVRDWQGYTADVLVVTPNRGAKYLRTRPDRVKTDNLLALPLR